VFHENKSQDTALKKVSAPPAPSSAWRFQRLEKAEVYVNSKLQNLALKVDSCSPVRENL
jgi:hypothetical protein